MLSLSSLKHCSCVQVALIRGRQQARYFRSSTQFGLGPWVNTVLCIYGPHCSWQNKWLHWEGALTYFQHCQNTTSWPKFRAGNSLQAFFPGSESCYTVCRSNKAANSRIFFFQTSLSTAFRVEANVWANVMANVCDFSGVFGKAGIQPCVISIRMNLMDRAWTQEMWNT